MYVRICVKCTILKGLLVFSSLHLRVSEEWQNKENILCNVFVFSLYDLWNFILLFLETPCVLFNL